MQAFPVQHVCVGFGAFGAVGFSYGGVEEAPVAAASESDSESDDSDDTEEGSDGEFGGDVDVEVAAAAFGVENFAAMLRHAEREEEAIANGKIPRRKCAVPPISTTCRLDFSPNALAENGNEIPHFNCVFFKICGFVTGC